MIIDNLCIIAITLLIADLLALVITEYLMRKEDEDEDDEK